MTKDAARIKAAKYLLWAEGHEKKSHELYEAFQRDHKDFDWTQPILRGHHSQRRHEKIFERRDSMMRKTIEHDAIAKRMREKAENLMIFANTNKGDAEARREAQRTLADKAFEKGGRAVDPVYGAGIITRVNKKTYTVLFDRGFTLARDKSYFVR